MSSLSSVNISLIISGFWFSTAKYNAVLSIIYNNFIEGNNLKFHKIYYILNMNFIEYCNYELF